MSGFNIWTTYKEQGKTGNFRIAKTSGGLRLQVEVTIEKVRVQEQRETYTTFRDFDDAKDRGNAELRHLTPINKESGQ
jgi:hypothetical protein